MFSAATSTSAANRSKGATCKRRKLALLWRYELPEIIIPGISDSHPSLFDRKCILRNSVEHSPQVSERLLRDFRSIDRGVGSQAALNRVLNTETRIGTSAVGLSSDFLSKSFLPKIDNLEFRLFFLLEDGRNICKLRDCEYPRPIICQSLIRDCTGLHKDQVDHFRHVDACIKHIHGYRDAGDGHSS